MAAHDPLPSASPYLRPPLQLKPGALLALLLIAGAHLAAIAGFLQLRAKVPPAVSPPPVMVRFLGAVAPEPVVEPPPPPPKPETPKPKPTIIASAQPTASAIEVPVEPEPQPEPTPAPQAPQAEAAPQIVPPNFVAAYLNNPAPAYPAMSIRLREQGTVMLLVLVSAGGSAEQVQVEQSSGFARLDAAAVEVVKRRWRFVPARQGEQAVAAWVRIPLSFELKQQ